ncbi:uncharacterized protein LOC132727215 [Ruditapes philippinarum]|uniref:uncharacterized protein LOC132727215 n=1 Tax=Ruditapes philippinarum TaxID=129788 RepID=UPI00295B9B8D|nr:uncharacterized protein LOC132727215 [Ruditapes philippinarum]
MATNEMDIKEENSQTEEMHKTDKIVNGKNDSNHRDASNKSCITKEACGTFLDNSDQCEKIANHSAQCKTLVNHTDHCKTLINLEHSAGAVDFSNDQSCSNDSGANTPLLYNGDDLSETSDSIARTGILRRKSYNNESCEQSCCSNNGIIINNHDLSAFNDQLASSEEEDTIASRLDIEKISSIKSKRSGSQKTKRKESFEQRLKRTFTIRDAHTSEVTKRALAIMIKYSLFIFNFVSWIMAVIAIGLGIWMRADKTLLVTSNTEFYLDLPLLTCIGGGITCIVAFLGCVGALRENLVLLRVFFYVLTFILIGEMILAIVVFVIYTVPEARDNFLRSQPEKILSSAIESYMDDTDVKEWVDRIQSEFKCCGISHTDEGFRDWQINPYFNCTSMNRSIYRCAVPTSCCIFEKGDRVNIMCGFEITDKPLNDVRDYIYTRGCIIGFGEWLGKYNDFIIISCLSVITMQFLAVLSAKIMVVRICKQRSRWRLLLAGSSTSCANTATRNT